MHIHQLPPEVIYQPLPKAPAKPKSEELEELHRTLDEEESLFRVNALQRDQRQRSDDDRQPPPGGSDPSGSDAKSPTARRSGRLDVFA